MQENRPCLNCYYVNIREWKEQLAFSDVPIKDIDLEELRQSGLAYVPQEQILFSKTFEKIFNLEKKMQQMRKYSK